MRFDRFTVIAGALCLAGTGAITFQALKGRPLATPENELAATRNAASAGEEHDADDGPDWSEECLAWPDPDDPHKPASVAGVHRDEIESMWQERPDDARELVSECTALADDTTDPEVVAQIRYQVARFEEVMGRYDDEERDLASIAEAYPAAAYALAVELVRDGEPDPGSSASDRVFALLVTAHKGNDHRAIKRLTAMMTRLYPMDELNLPTLFSAIYFGKPELVPDNVSTRMAASSLWRGYTERCQAWEVIVIAPSDQAVIANYMASPLAQRAIGLIQNIPNMIQSVSDWVHNIGSITLMQAIRDINRAKAYPAQLLFLADTAGIQDGSHVYDKFTCSGPRAARFYRAMIQFFREREPREPAPAGDHDLDPLLVKPDPAALI